MLWIQKKKFFKSLWRENRNSNCFSRQVLQEPRSQYSLQGPPAKPQEWKGALMRDRTKMQGRKARGTYDINDQQTTSDLPAAKRKRDTNTAAKEISD